MSLPYSIACLVFCLIMVPAGRMQDRMGPRIVGTIGGILVGLGMILAWRIPDQEYAKWIDAPGD